MLRVFVIKAVTWSKNISRILISSDFIGESTFFIEISYRIFGMI